MTRHGKAIATSSMAEGSSSKITDSSTGTTQQTRESQDTETPFAGEVVGQIEAVVESFRTSKIKKLHAIYQIGQILAGVSVEDERVKSDSLDRYAATLDSIEALATQSNEHGSRFTIPVLGKRRNEPSGGSQQYEQLDGDIPRDAHTTDVDNFLEAISRGSKHDSELGRNDSGEESDNDRESSIDPGERGRSNKKQRIYESQMPWFSKEQRIRKSNTNPSCNSTRNTLDVFQRDPPTIKRWIRCAFSAPAGFPSTEWDALIKGETVDIDTVFSSLHHIHSIDESIGRVGSTEIQFGRPKPAAKVETSGQWTAAFNLIVKATAFLFPHRYDELRQYGDYMEELFSAKSTAIHPKLFKYDQAVRYKVGQGQNILLTDRDQFTRYYEAIVASDGVGIEGSSEGNKGGPRKGGKPRDKSDICHRFNGANGCSATAEKCKYKHICKKCKSSGHGKMDCKVNEGV